MKIEIARDILSIKIYNIKFFLRDKEHYQAILITIWPGWAEIPFLAFSSFLSERIKQSVVSFVKGEARFDPCFSLPMAREPTGLG